MNARPGLLLALVLGFGLWAAGFAAIYGVQGVGCARGWDAVDLGPLTMLRALLIVLVAATMAAIAIVAARLQAASRQASAVGTPEALILAISSAAAWLAVPATAATFAGTIALTAC
jgi:hypothetical protein